MMRGSGLAIETSMGGIYHTYFRAQALTLHKMKIPRSKTVGIQRFIVQPVKQAVVSIFPPEP